MSIREEALRDFKASLLHRWTPLVALIASDDAESYCHTCESKSILDVFTAKRRVQKLNDGLGGALNNSELLDTNVCHFVSFPIALGQIGYFNTTVVPIRTPAEYPIRLHELNLRFCRAVDVTPLHSPSDLEKADHMLAEVTLRVLDSRIPYRDLDLSYFEEYRDQLSGLLRFQVHETQDNPLVCTFCRDGKSINYHFPDCPGNHCRYFHS